MSLSKQLDEAAIGMRVEGRVEWAELLKQSAARIRELEAEVAHLKKPPVLDKHGEFWCQDTRDAFYWGQTDAYAVIAAALHLPPYDESTQTRIRHRCSQLIDFYLEHREAAEKARGD